MAIHHDPGLLEDSYFKDRKSLESLYVAISTLSIQLESRGCGLAKTHYKSPSLFDMYLKGEIGEEKISQRNDLVIGDIWNYSSLIFVRTVKALGFLLKMESQLIVKGSIKSVKTDFPENTLLMGQRKLIVEFSEIYKKKKDDNNLKIDALRIYANESNRIISDTWAIIEQFFIAYRNLTSYQIAEKLRLEMNFDAGIDIYSALQR